MATPEEQRSYIHRDRFASFDGWRLSWPVSAMNSYAAGAIVLLLFLVGNTCAEICEQPRSIAYNTLEVTLKNGTMEAFGFEYVPGTFWKKDEDTYVGCPCMIHKCLQYCAGD